MVLVRERARAPWGPLAVFLITIWSWSIFSALDPLVQYVIPALHALQYFFFVALLTRNEALSRDFGPPPSAKLGLLAASELALGFCLFHLAPGILDGALVPRVWRYEDIGPTPFLAAFFVFVNVHHYLMDNVLWRRENPETRFLAGPS